jgi:hypothetical protein
MFLLATFAVPFLLIWFFFIMTAFTINPQAIFSHPIFWVCSTIYWIFWTTMSNEIIELIENNS